MSEMSLHYCLSDIATFWNKGDLHLFSYQRLISCCTEKKILTLLHTSGYFLFLIEEN